MPSQCGTEEWRRCDRTGAYQPQPTHGALHHDLTRRQHHTKQRLRYEGHRNQNCSEVPARPSHHSCFTATDKCRCGCSLYVELVARQTSAAIVEISTTVPGETKNRSNTGSRCTPPECLFKGLYLSTPQRYLPILAATHTHTCQPYPKLGLGKSSVCSAKRITLLNLMDSRNHQRILLSLSTTTGPPCTLS